MQGLFLFNIKKQLSIKNSYRKFIKERMKKIGNRYKECLKNNLNSIESTLFWTSFKRFFFNATDNLKIHREENKTLKILNDL